MEATECDTHERAASKGLGGSTDSSQTLQTDPLFQPWTLGEHQLKHRIVYAPLTRCRALDPGYVPGDNMYEYYSQRARGCEGGLIIAEATVINNTGHGYVLPKQKD